MARQKSALDEYYQTGQGKANQISPFQDQADPEVTGPGQPSSQATPQSQGGLSQPATTTYQDQQTADPNIYWGEEAPQQNHTYYQTPAYDYETWRASAASQDAQHYDPAKLFADWYTHTPITRGKAGATAGGALSGFSAGARGGPIGMAVGAGLGALMGHGAGFEDPTKVYLGDARGMVTRGMQQYWGHTPTEAELNAILGTDEVLNRAVVERALINIPYLKGLNPDATPEENAVETALTEGGAWGLSPGGQRVEFPDYQAPTGAYQPGAYRHQMEGFNADKFDPSHPEANSLKMVAARAMESIDPYAADAVDQLIAQFAAMGIPAEKAAADKVFFPTSGEVVDVLRNASYVENPQTGSVAWAWMPDAPYAAAASSALSAEGGGGSSYDLSHRWSELFPNENYQSVIQAILGDVLAGRRPSGGVR